MGVNKTGKEKEEEEEGKGNEGKGKQKKAGAEKAPMVRGVLKKQGRICRQMGYEDKKNMESTDG